MSRSLTIPELGAALDIGQLAALKFETGLVVPPDDVIDRLAIILEYPRAFFYQDGYIAPLPSWFFNHIKPPALP